MTSPEFYDAVLDRIDAATAIGSLGLALLVTLGAIVAVRALWSR